MSSAEFIAFVPKKVAPRAARVERRVVPPAAQAAPAADEAVLQEHAITQLREIVNGPFQRISEARYIEFIDILDEQRKANDMRFSAVGIDQQRADTRAKHISEGLDKRLVELNARLEAATDALRTSHAEAFEKLRQEQLIAQNVMNDTFVAQFNALESSVRGAITELTNSISAHVFEDNKKREADKVAFHELVERRVTETLATVAQDQKRDINEVANNLVEIGYRMMETRKV